MGWGDMAAALCLREVEARRGQVSGEWVGQWGMGSRRVDGATCLWEPEARRGLVQVVGGYRWGEGWSRWYGGTVGYGWGGAWLVPCSRQKQGKGG